MVSAIHTCSWISGATCPAGPYQRVTSTVPSLRAAACYCMGRYVSQVMPPSRSHPKRCRSLRTRSCKAGAKQSIARSSSLGANGSWHTPVSHSLRRWLECSRTPAACLTWCETLLTANARADLQFGCRLHAKRWPSLPRTKADADGLPSFTTRYCLPGFEMLLVWACISGNAPQLGRKSLPGR